MRLLDRYILKEFLVPFFYCIMAFSMLFVVMDLFTNLDEILESDVANADVGIYYLCKLSQAIEYLIPISLLLATLYCLAQLTRHHELIAMRAGGQSLLRIILPLIHVGIFFSLAVTAVTEFIAPEALVWADHFDKRVRGRKVEKAEWVVLPYKNNATDNVWNITRFWPDQPNYLRGVHVEHRRKDSGKKDFKWLGREAKYLDGEWWFYGLEVTAYDDEGYELDRRQFDVPTKAKDWPAYMPQLQATWNDMLLDYQINTQGKQAASLPFNQLRGYIDRQTKVSMKKRASLLVSMHSKLAVPWVCLIAVLMGIPAGAKTGREGMLKGVMLAFIAFFLIWGTTISVQWLGKIMLLSPILAAWLPNIGFGLFGASMALRIK